MITPCPVYCPNLTPGINQEDWTNANANSMTMEAALADKYGVLLLPPGSIHFDRPITITRPVIIRGSGQCSHDEAAISTTKLIFPSVSKDDLGREGHGIVIKNTAGRTSIEDLTVFCVNALPPLENKKGSGIVVQASSVNLAKIVVARFGEHGVTFISDENNSCNECSLTCVMSAYNGNTGYYVTHTSSESKSNRIAFLACRAYGNQGYGFYDAGASNLYLHCLAHDNNYAPAYRLMKQGGALISPYAEGSDEGVKMVFGPDSTGWTALLPMHGRPTTVNENDAVHPVVIYSG